MPDPSDKETIVAYLLGRLEGTAKDRFEDQYFTEDELFDQLQDIEEKLLDDYLQNRLPRDQRKQFEKRLRSNPHRWKHVEFTRAVQQRGESLVLRVSPRGRLIPAMSVALLLVIGVALWTFIENRDLRKRLEMMAVRQPELPAPSLVQRVQLGSPPEDVVNRGLDASGRDPEIIRLRQEALVVEMTLTFPEPDARGLYTAVLLGDGLEQASYSRLSPRIVNGVGQLTMHLPAAQLPQGSYVIQLKNSHGQILKSFPFDLLVR